MQYIPLDIFNKKARKSKLPGLSGVYFKSD